MQIIKPALAILILSQFAAFSQKQNKLNDISYHHFKYNFEPSDTITEGSRCINCYDYIEFDNSGLWQIGIPNKEGWDSAYNGQYALMTDTLNSINEPKSASFIFKWERHRECNCVPYISIDMFTLYDLPIGNAGVIFEYSYDFGQSWINFMESESTWISNFWYINSIENTSVLSGEKDNWFAQDGIYRELYGCESINAVDTWFRFTYMNIGNIVHKGIIIDDLVFDIGCWCEFPNCDPSFLNDKNLNHGLHPNPLSSSSVLTFLDTYGSDVTLEVYNTQGQMIYIDQGCENFFVLNKENFYSGVFKYVLFNTQGLVLSGKFLVK